MKTAALGLIALAAVPLAGAALRSHATLAAPVKGVAADGTRAAIVVGSSRRDCTHVVVWTRNNGSLLRLGRKRPCGPTTSTGSGIARVSFATPRALWLSYVGGNIREWSLWTASVRNPRPRLVAFVARDVDESSPIVLGKGDNAKDGQILPYAVGDTVVSLGADGRRRFSWKASDRVVALAAKNGELAVALEAGPAVILDSRGRVLRTELFASRVDAVSITGSALLVQRGLILELRGGGLAPKTWELPVGARLADTYGDLAVYTRVREIHVLDLDTGKDVVVRRTSSPPHAQIEATGLVYGSGRRVTAVPIAQILRLLRSS